MLIMNVRFLPHVEQNSFCDVEKCLLIFIITMLWKKTIKEILNEVLYLNFQNCYYELNWSYDYSRKTQTTDAVWTNMTANHLKMGKTIVNFRHKYYSWLQRGRLNWWEKLKL